MCKYIVKSIISNDNFKIIRSNIIKSLKIVIKKVNFSSTLNCFLYIKKILKKLKKNNSNNNEYWKSNLKFVLVLLAVWFIVSFGFGILLVEYLNEFQIGGFPLGFWFSQQGSIYIFVILIFIYIYLMNKLDKKFK